MSHVSEQRIDRLINHLIPDIAFQGRYGPPQPLDKRMAYYHTPGVSISVINEFEIEWARGFGLCETGKSIAVTPSTLFQAGSISKPIFALAVMRLVEDNHLDLDGDVNNYLTSWQVPPNGTWQPRITLRQLLSHTAGLTVHGFPGYQTSELIPTVPQILNGERPANTPKVEVNILPGVQFRYSGGGTTIAQQLLVDALGKSFPEIMRTLVLDPLRMADSTYEQFLPKDWTTKAATAHPWKEIPLTGKWHVYPEMAAAGLWTTATDLAKVGVELLQALRGKPRNLLAPETIEAMIHPQLPDQQEGGEFVGLGFFCNGRGDSFSFGHAGWNEGFVALMRIYRNLGKGAVVMVNSNEGHPLLEEIMRAIAWEYEWPGVFSQEKPRIDLARTDTYAGVYATQVGMQFYITIQNGTVMLRLGQQSPLPLSPISELDFVTEAVNTSVRFEKGQAGDMTAVIVSQEGKVTRAERQQ